MNDAIKKYIRNQNWRRVRAELKELLLSYNIEDDRDETEYRKLEEAIHKFVSFIENNTMLD